MTTLFQDLTVGDKLYWAHLDKWDRITVEAYKILEVCYYKNGKITQVCINYCGSHWMLSLNSTDKSHKRDDGSYFVMDKDGIKWAVKRLKERLIEKYTKKIDDTRLRLTTLLLEDYIFISKC